MSVVDIFTVANPTGSLVRFVLGIYEGVIEGDARAARERIRAYRQYLSLTGVANGSIEEITEALTQAHEAGLIPAPLTNKGTVITGRFSAQTEWHAGGEAGVKVGIGAVPLNLSVSASYGRQQAESSEFTIYLEPVSGDSMFKALAEMHTDATREKVLPPTPTPPQ